MHSFRKSSIPHFMINLIFISSADIFYCTNCAFSPIPWLINQFDLFAIHQFNIFALIVHTLHSTSPLPYLCYQFDLLHNFWSLYLNDPSILNDFFCIDHKPSSNLRHLYHELSINLIFLPSTNSIFCTNCAYPAFFVTVTIPLLSIWSFT